jgi:hypothetical protein
MNPKKTHKYQFYTFSDYITTQASTTSSWFYICSRIGLGNTEFAWTCRNMTYCHWWIHRSSKLLTHWYIGVANVRLKDVLEKSFHSSATFYSAESKLVLISKYIKTIDQVFRGSKNNNHKSHTYRLFDSIIFNTFFSI